MSSSSCVLIPPAPGPTGPSAPAVEGVGRALENDTEGGAEGESGAEGRAVSQPKSACPAESVGDGWRDGVRTKLPE